MTSPRQLAAALGVGIPADLPPKLTDNSPLTTHQRERWSPQVKDAFQKMQPHALVLVGTRGPVSVAMFEGGEIVRRFGGNRGCWPLKLSSSGAWKDTITTTYNRGPFFFTGALFRLWCESAIHEAQLSDAVGRLLRHYREAAFGVDLEGGFTDVGPELDLDTLCGEIRSIASGRELAVWDDEDLVRELERRAVRRTPAMRRS